MRPPVNCSVHSGGNTEDRAQIEDLQARYLFALDFRDPEVYAATFTEDGVLDYGAGKIVGRKAIAEMVAGMRAAAERQRESGARRAAELVRALRGRAL